MRGAKVNFCLVRRGVRLNFEPYFAHFPTPPPDNYCTVPNKGKMNAYYFRKDKTAVLGAIKAQLPFSGGKYQLLISWNEIPYPTVFYRLNFQLPHPSRSNSVSSQTYPVNKKPIKGYEKAENCILSLLPIFSRWVPLSTACRRNWVGS